MVRKEHHTSKKHRPAPVEIKDILLFGCRLALLAVLCATPSEALAAAADARGPNIVLIYADDLGYGDISCNGATGIQTPHIDRLAREGLRFTDAHSTSATCTPSRYALLTGEYPWRKRGTGVLPGNAPLIIEPGRETVATVLRRAGYKTGVVGKWHLGLGRAGMDWNGEIKPGPLELGFDYCFLMPATGDRVPCVYVENHRVVGLDPKNPLQVSFAGPVGDEPTGKANPHLLRVHPSHGHDQTIVNGVSRIGYSKGGRSAQWSDEDMAEVYVRKATDFITRNKNERFFLYFATHDIHVPRMPHARFEGKSGMGARGDVILQLDWCVGELLGALEQNGLDGNTLVIFSSDNGPVVDDGYRDEAKEKLGDHKPAGPFRGGKYSILEAGTRVPFIVRWPGRVSTGVSDALLCQIDLLASFAALTEQSFDASTAPDSQNMLTALLGDSRQGRKTLVEHAGGLALRQGEWKFIPKRPGVKRAPLTDTETGNDPEIQLYDLAADVREMNNLSASNPNKAGELASLLEAEKAKGFPPPAAAKPAAKSAPKPNIVFILCDDLGINDLHCYGRLDHKTPNLDRLATQGMRFTSAYCAQPICSPSRAAILTGKTPARLHLTTYLPGRPNATSQRVLHPEIQMQVPLSEKMLPRFFKDAGYACAAIGKWHVGGKGFGPLEHGFDVAHAGNANTKPSATEGGKGEFGLTAAAEKFIESNQDRPFLLYLAHNTPHIPYTAQDERIQGNSGAFEPVYAGVIETLDITIGRLLAKLDSLKIADRTIVIFTSDNGGLHVPEGPHPKVTYNTPFRAGKGFVYEGGLRVPLIVRWPGHVPAGVVADEPVINTDWLPTLLELAGEPIPNGLDGLSLAARLTGRGPVPQRNLFWHFPHYTNQGSRPSGAIREGDWLLVEFYDDERAELYDLSRDIRQTQDLASQQPGRVSRMRAALASWRQSVDAQGNRPNPDFDPARFRELYVDVDASRFMPEASDEPQWQKMWQWRKAMDSVPKLPKAAPVSP